MNNQTNDKPRDLTHGEMVSPGDEFNHDATFYCAKCGAVHTTNYSGCDGLRGGWKIGRSGLDDLGSPKPGSIVEGHSIRHPQPTREDRAYSVLIALLASPRAPFATNTDEYANTAWALVDAMEKRGAQ